MESAEAIFAGYRKSLSMIQLWKEKSERMGALQDTLRDEEIEAMMLTSLDKGTQPFVVCDG